MRPVRTLIPSMRPSSFISLGAMELQDLMVAEHNLAPSSYDRAKVMKKCENALRACGVPESMVRPSEVTAIYWVVKLDLSTPGAEGEPRSFNDLSELLPDFLGGNITVGVLRVLAKCISRASRNNEIDVWDYHAGYEDWIARQDRAPAQWRTLDSPGRAPVRCQEESTGRCQEAREVRRFHRRRDRVNGEG